MNKRDRIIVFGTIFALAVFPVPSLASDQSEAMEENSSAASVFSGVETPASEEGGVLRIVTMDSALEDMLKQYDPSYQEDKNGQVSLNGIPVRWTVTSSDGSGYEDWLDATLPLNGTLEADDRVDLFLLDDASLRKYRDSALTETLDGDLGIPSDAFSDSYDFVKTAAEDENGYRRAVSFLLEPGTLIYDREMAEQVLGSGEPDDVQETVKDFSVLEIVAKKASAAGVSLFSSADEMFPLFSSAREEGWVEKNNRDELSLTVPDAMKEWAETSASFQTEGVLGENPLFMTEIPDAKTSGQDDEKNALGMVKGPAVWLKTVVWILCAAGTDNPEADADLIRTMTLDKDILRARAIVSGDFLDAKSLMEETSKDYQSARFGGQNTRKVLSAQAEALGKMKRHTTIYDGQLDSLYREAMAPFIAGTETYAFCEKTFRKQVRTYFPELQA